jgi:hypothetical protein
MSLIIDGSAGVTFPAGGNPQAAPAGVIQVVQGTLSTQTSTASSSFSDIGLSATITPKFSTSKILAFVTLAGTGKNSADTNVKFILLRGSTNIFNIESQGGETGTSALNIVGACAGDCLDSPATTSATTYKVQMSNSAASGLVYVCATSGTTPTSTITLMEIAQ